MIFKSSIKILLIALFIVAVSDNMLAQIVNKGENKENLLLDGIKYYNTSNLDSAKAKFTQLIRIDPTNDAAYYYLANISLLNNDDITSGEVFLKKAIELDTTNYWYTNLLGQIYIKTNNLEKAIEVYENLVTIFPKKTDSYYTLTNLYLNKQDIIKTKDLLDKIEKISGKSEALAMTRFNLYRMEQNWEGALKYLVEFDKELPSAKVSALIADMYADRFRDTLAISYYNKALDMEPDCAPAIYGRAEVYRMKGDYDRYFSDIIPFFSNKLIDPELKGDYLKQLFKTPGFLQRFKYQVDTIITNLEAAHPKDSSTMFLAAAYYSQKGDSQKCLSILENNYTLYPNSYDAMFQYITYIYHLKEWEKLIVESKKALEKYPNNIDLTQLIGIAEFSVEKYNEALDTYKKLVDIALADKDTTTIVTSYSILGDLYSQLKDKKQCYANYKKALKYDPNYNPVLNNYAYYLAEERKQLKNAYEMSKKTIETEPDNPTYLDTFGWILYLMNKPIEAKAQFKHAMLYGGKESAAILDHYAEVLYILGEHDLAFIYWDQAKALDKTLGIEEKIKLRKEQLKK